ncbi:hypothetical protein B0T19DRAFT_429357 [Cercophora scortea]|uniref:Uncharacterized protein n=1 Tax=Cercophora scortea TaxID=314031 RepID=A0AAE0IGJ7_9PEZI|nr:hypothetical protein B0T19DRAFT_429357 [Cercophora scortea]
MLLYLPGFIYCVWIFYLGYSASPFNLSLPVVHSKRMITFFFSVSRRRHLATQATWRLLIRSAVPGSYKPKTEKSHIQVA